MAEAFNSLFIAELVRNRGPWKNINDLEIAVAEYIDWFNFRRLHGEIGLVPPVEFETQHQTNTPPSSLLSGSWKPPSNPVLDSSAPGTAARPPGPAPDGPAADGAGPATRSALGGRFYTCTRTPSR